MVVLLLACAACSSDAGPATPVPPPVPLDAGVTGAGSTAPPPVVTEPTVFTTATAELTPFAGATLTVSGKATFRTTTMGVDLTVELQGCQGGQQYTQQILEAASCMPQVVQAPVWSDGRGSGIAPVFCFGGGLARAGTSYARLATRTDAWTIGGPAASELTGRVLVVYADGGEPIACGAITRTPDVVRTPMPPEAQPPRVETRAVLGGLCFGRQFPNSGPGCPDARGLYDCAKVHCDLGSCFETCEAYLSCLDTQEDVCAIAGCELTAECAQCQDDVLSCALGFCAEHATCAPRITPDGPCQQLASCCLLQGDRASSCLGVLTPLLTTLGGDANCIGSMHDWDVLSHMHVPCKFGPPQMDASGSPPVSPDVREPDGEPRLADGFAGVACATDAECPGGRCERDADGGAGGYCTRACLSSYECGSEGICATIGDQGSDRRCLGKCQAQEECRPGFVCAGGLHGARLNVPGSCRPYRRVASLADRVAGRACANDVECPGGQCASTNLLGTSYPGNYCTGRCYADTHCGEGGVCGWPVGGVDPGYCLQACAADADCTRQGYGCWQMGDGKRVIRACYPRAAPLPEGTVGQPCTQPLDCEGASCAAMLPYEGLATSDLTPAPEGYCTQPCALDAECGSGGQCINYGSEGGICLARCSDSVPCRGGYTCFTHNRDEDPLAAVCVPAETPAP
jgi:hypothetical protein